MSIEYPRHVTSETLVSYICEYLIFSVKIRLPRCHLVVKNPPANAGDTGDVGLIPRLRRSPGVGNGNPFEYSYLQNPVDRGAWQATVHEVTKSWTRLKQLSMHVKIKSMCKNITGQDFIILYIK